MVHGEVCKSGLECLSGGSELTPGFGEVYIVLAERDRRVLGSPSINLLDLSG